jgi:putative membrane protein
MQGAFVVSGIFLVSYVVRFMLTGTHKFPDVGVVRSIYLLILSSHTLLAMAALPLAVRTLYLARKGRIDSHKRLARYTFPIWAYVSVTGIVVYVMLYHLAPRLTLEAPSP